jgi:hypothetical protein
MTICSGSWFEKLYYINSNILKLCQFHPSTSGHAHTDNVKIWHLLGGTLILLHIHCKYNVTCVAQRLLDILAVLATDQGRPGHAKLSAPQYTYVLQHRYVSERSCRAVSVESQLIPAVSRFSRRAPALKCPSARPQALVLPPKALRDGCHKETPLSDL